MARRLGGRQARRAARAAPLAEAVKPVRPGQTGGQYRPLSTEGVAAIVDNAFRILERVGFADATPHCIETCTAVGAVLGDDGRLRMPRSLVESTLMQARRNLVLHAQDPRRDLDLSGTRVHFSTAGA
ncbi:MAG: trimethylamine methyltransferase family protein, partial [Rhodospirillaceae bacterium]|nr:trimethylamine methyltransferase family protein [Rhodospirillaceae bacterium]